jgi:capsular exopolysaccharide synthesis family protein
MELKDYFRILRRSIWPIILIILVVAGGGYYWSIRQAPVYQSSSTLLITIPEAKTSSQSYEAILTLERQAKTLAEMVLGSPVLKGASATSTVPLLVDSLDAVPVKDTQFIQLTYTGTDPVQVQTGLKTIADYFSKYVSQLYYGQGADSASVLEEQLKRSQIDLENAQRQLNGLATPSVSELEVAQAKVTFFQGLYLEYLKQLDEVRSSQTSYLTRVLVYEPANLPVLPISPRTALNTTVAAVLGLFLGVGFAFLRDYFDDTLKSEEDVGKFMKGLPVLGAVPVIPRNAMSEDDNGNALPWPLHPSGKGVPFVALVGNTKSAAAEGFRTLRTNLQFLSADKPLKVLVISSSAAAEGKTTVALNLASSLTQMGQRVLLVDADLRRPSLHRSFNLAAAPGLSNFLVGKADLSAVLKKTPIEGLQVLPSGPIPPMPAELLGSHRMVELLNQLRQQFDTVLLDTPPVIAVTDATLLATMADGLLLVVTCGRTTREQAKVALLTLEKAGITPLGVVMNQVDRRKGYGYYYYYYHRYYRRYQQDAELEQKQ